VCGFAVAGRRWYRGGCRALRGRRKADALELVNKDECDTQVILDFAILAYYS
jgi:hypothetical protein